MAFKFARASAGRSLPPEMEELRRQLAEARHASERWKERAEKQQARNQQLQQRLDAEVARRTELAAKYSERRRSALSHRVLDHVIAGRVRRRPLLRGDLEAAAAREERHLASSDAYREGIARLEERSARLRRMDVGGIPWWVPRDERVVGREARLQAQAFPMRAILQTRELSIGGIMLDLGANIGRTSVTRVLLGDVRAVYAAEPEPVNYSCLLQNVVEHGLRGFVMPDQVAIGGMRGVVRLRRSAYIGGHRVLAQDAADAGETVDVPLWPVDEWIDRLGIERDAVTFVKVDTQGSEVGVLTGAASLLSRPNVAWQIEVDPGLLTRMGRDVSELLALFEQHFTHFIDLFPGASGNRVRQIADLREALSYVGTQQNKTDLLLYSATR